MKKSNLEIADYLRKTADLLEINGDNPYRIRAYRRAARSIETYPDNLADLLSTEFDLTLLRFVGKGIAAYIREIISNDQQPVPFRRIQPKNLSNSLKRIEGLGKKRIQILNEFEIYNKEQLLEAIQQGKLNELKGFGHKLQIKIFNSIKYPKFYEKFYKLRLASLILESFKEHLLTLNCIREVIFAGSYRRRNEVIGNSELILVTNNPSLAIEQSLTLTEIDEIVEASDKFAIVILRSGMLVKLITSDETAKGAALLYYTGSESHIKTLKQIANTKKLELSPTGLFQKQKCIAKQSEKQIYTKLNLKYVEPELREGRGEIKAAARGQLPKLINLKNIKGDLHCHTNATDGTVDLEVMVRAAEEIGYQYIAITDHTKRLTITNGLDEKRLLAQIKLIDKLNSKLKYITVLKSSEVDILEDGSLDLPDYILKELDLRVCSVHSKFNLSEEKQTERIIRAMDNPYFNILGHPTGRLINYRPPYPVNLIKILEAAKSRNCFVELNAQPSRLDLNDHYCLIAKRMGVKLAISSDAHSIPELSFMKYGIYQGRRGWLEPDDVINTSSLPKLMKLLKR